jgi:hypothetical protein
MNTRAAAVYSVLTIVSAMALPALAQPATTDGKPTPSGLERPEGPWRTRFELSADYDLGSDLKDTPGEVSVFRAGADFGVSVPAWERGIFNFGLGYSRWYYDFDNANQLGLGADKPWEDTQGLGFSATFVFRQTNKFVWTAGAFANSSMELNADFSDSMTFGGLAGFSYALTENFRVGPAIVVSTVLEDTVRVIPGLLFDWKIAERWSLTNESRPGLSLNYEATDSLELSLSGFWVSNEFRLDDDGAASGGVGRDRLVPIRLAAEWKATEKLTLIGKVGVIMFREFEVNNSNGDELSSARVEPGLTLSVGLKLAF